MYLYFLGLIRLFRHRRFYVEGCERDQAMIEMGKIWGTPGRWVRNGIIRAIVLEIGDILQAEEVVEGDIDAETFPENLSGDTERQIAIKIRDAQA